MTHIIQPLFLITTAALCLTGFTQNTETIRAVCERIETSVARGEADTFAKLIDMDAIVDPYFADLPDATSKREFLLGVKSAGGKSLVDGILLAINNGGTYQLVNIKQQNGRPYAIFRLDQPDGLNYHGLSFSKKAPHRVTDMFVFLTGANIGETFVSGYKTMLAADGVIAALTGKQKKVMADMRTYADMIRSFREGDPNAALQAYDRLSKDMQDKKMVQIVALQASMLGENENAYGERILKYMKDFPKDPSLALVSMDFYVVSQKYDTALGMVDQLDEQVGGDPFLDTLRGNIHLMAGDPDKAATALIKAARAFPDNPDPMFSLIDVYNAKPNFPAAVKLMRFLEKKHGMSLPHEHLSSEPAFADLIQSAEYKAYNASR